MPSIVTPSRRAWIACPSSCRTRQAKKIAVAVTPMAAYVCQLRPGRASGNWTAESDHRISPKTTSQLQFRPISTPATRPSTMVDRMETTGSHAAGS